MTFIVYCLIALLLIFGLPFIVIAFMMLRPAARAVAKEAHLQRQIGHGLGGSIGHGITETFSEVARRILGPIVERAAHIRPLPSWTNGYLLIYALAIWAFAIGLNWYGDNLSYVVISLVILALYGLNIFLSVAFDKSPKDT